MITKHKQCEQKQQKIYKKNLSKTRHQGVPLGRTVTSTLPHVKPR